MVFPWHVWVSYPAIVVTILVVTLIVFDDFTRRPIAPYTLKKRAAEEASRLEKELRAEYRHPNKQLEAKRKEYQKLVKLGTLKSYPGARRSDCLHSFGPDLACRSLYADILLVSRGGFTIHNDRWNTAGEPSKNKLVLVYILLLTWFPLRLHTEWYQNYFHKKDWLKSYPAFWLLAFLAAAVLVLIILIVKPGGTIKFLSVLNGAFVLVLGAIGKFKPDWLRAAADFLQSTSFVYFLAIYLIFLVLIAAVTAAVWVHS